MQFTSRLVHLLLLLPLAALLISPSGSDRTDQHNDAVPALSPDDTLFAHLRCFELFASGQQSSGRDADASDWLGCDRERYLHRTDRTPAFVKCVLRRMRFYDSLERRFNANLLRAQYNEYKRWMTLTEEDVESFVDYAGDIGQLNSSSEEDVYNAFKLLFNNHSTIFFQLFLRDTTVLQNMYNDKVNEIARDYAMVGTLGEASRESIEQCARTASEELNIPKRSLSMYGCLLRGSNSEIFKHAFDFREIRSGNLTFLLQNLPYDRDQVKQQIVELDKEHCNEQQPPAV
uniref:Uncharacterized protein n=1 Tax=Anopheles epiroticus TaxID=199890 RepID=A0A240PKX5_9DIPT